MKTLIAAGGTGGHIYPALALAQRLRESGDTMIWGGSVRRMEQDIAMKEGFDFRGFDIRRPFEGFSWIYRDLSAFMRIVSLMKKEGVDRVVCAGGYISFFFAAAARLRGIPYYLLEQNVIPGKVTRRTAGRAEKIFVSFEETKKMLKRGNIVCTGNPVRKSILETTCEGGYLTVLGGSLGARSINKAVLDMANQGFFRERGIKLIWITGTRDYEMVTEALKEERGIEVFAYRDDMENVYRDTDMIISRAGATALAEFFALGIPAVLVPYPYAKDDHQTENARAAVAEGAYLMVRESGGLAEELQRALLQLDKIRHEVKREIKSLSAVEKIVEELG